MKIELEPSIKTSYRLQLVEPCEFRELCWFLFRGNKPPNSVGSRSELEEPNEYV